MSVRVLSFGYRGTDYHIYTTGDQLTIVATGAGGARRKIVVPAVEFKNLGRDRKSLAAFCEASLLHANGEPDTQ